MTAEAHASIVARSTASEGHGHRTAPSPDPGAPAVRTGGGSHPLVAFSGADTGSAIRSLAGMYAGKRWYARPTDRAYWYRYVGIGDDQLSIRRSQMSGYLRGEIATEGEVVVQWLERGDARLDIGRDEVRMRPGIPIMFPPERRIELQCQNWDQRLVHLDRALVLDVAAERYLTAGGLVFDDRSGPVIAAVGPWQAAVGRAIRVLRETGESSLAWREAQRDVARSLLHLYPLQAEALPDRYGERPNRRLHAAVDFIHAHAQEPLTISDIATAADLSVRGLQDSFRRVLGRTPMAYVREVRLARARQELRTRDPGTTTVGAVALTWGFTHMGRFSSAYSARFGEYPKNTLRA